MNRKIVIQSRVSEFEVELLKKLADEQGVKPSEYLRWLLRSAAQKNGLLPDAPKEPTNTISLAA